MTETFGKTSAGWETALYTLENKNGMQIAVADYGATLVKVLVPDREGKLVDVVLGYDDAAGYETGDKFSELSWEEWLTALAAPPLS